MGDFADPESSNPWTSPAARKIQTRGGFQEPHGDDEGDIAVTPISYPPASQNPFNQSRGNMQKIIDASSAAAGRRSIDAEADTASPFDTTSPSISPVDRTQPKYDTTPTSVAFSETVPSNQRVVLGVAVVDFNHLVGPTVEWSYPDSLTDALKRDQELTRLLPFLALPDGAHLVSPPRSIRKRLDSRIAFWEE